MKTKPAIEYIITVDDDDVIEVMDECIDSYMQWCLSSTVLCVDRTSTLNQPTNEFDHVDLQSYCIHRWWWWWWW